MDLYLVRHGESNIPQDAIQQDYPLSPLGLEQARLLGERFRGLKLDRLITTPYQRTQQTAAGWSDLGASYDAVSSEASGYTDNFSPSMVISGGVPWISYYATNNAGLLSKVYAKSWNGTSGPWAAPATTSRR